MKVIFINRYFFPDYSATSQLLTDIATSLAKPGNEIHIVTSRQIYGNPSAQLQRHEKINGIAVHRVWTSRFGRNYLPGRVVDYLTFYLSGFALLLRIAKPGNVIVALTDPPMISLFASLAAKLKGAVLVNWCQDVFPEVASALHIIKPGGYLEWLLRIFRNHSLRGARLNVVLGERMAEFLENQAINETSVRIIHNWSDGAHIRPIKKHLNPLRKAWKLENRFVVGYSGNMGRAHEFATIIEAARLLKDDSEITFCFIGGGARKSDIIQATEELRLTRVIFKPYQPRENLAESLSVPDIHLISLRSELEGLIVPSKFYGIAAAGRPCIYIGDRDGEIARILGHCDCGSVVNIGDAESLAGLIKQLKKNLPLCEQLGQNARKFFTQYYDRPVAQSAWMKVMDVIKA